MLEPSFTLILNEEYFAKNDVVMVDPMMRGVITKVYKRTRWRRFWTYLGFDMGLTPNGIKFKVKPIN